MSKISWTTIRILKREIEDEWKAREDLAWEIESLKNLSMTIKNKLGSKLSSDLIDKLKCL